MLRNSFYVFLLLVISAVGLESCGSDENVAETFDPFVQFEKEKELIREYLSENDYPEDTTVNGVRMVVLDEGNGIPPLTNDVVFFDFAGKFLSQSSDGEVIDTLYFDTTVFSIAERELGATVNSPLTFKPFVYSYSEDGWTLTSSSGGPQFIPGFRVGVTELFKKMGPGGSGEIILPSNTAYGTLGTTGIGANQTIIFELYLRRVDK